MVDGMLRDGLEDAVEGYAMGLAGEHCAAKYQFTRKDQDDYAIASYQKALYATEQGLFQSEIESVTLAPAKSHLPSTVVSKDEELTKYNEQKLQTLKPSFKVDGTVTPGNAPGISDGAAAVVLVSGDYLNQMSCKPAVYYRVLAFADNAQAPIEFTTSPAGAIQKALDLCQSLPFEKIPKSISDLSSVEINEAFSVVGLANAKLLGLDSSRLNRHGGAVALGHPIGCSGARIVVTLCSVLASQHTGPFGCAAVCNGGGGSTALIIEKIG